MVDLNGIVAAVLVFGGLGFHTVPMLILTAATGGAMTFGMM
ncbi:hypothetical protein LOM8899_01926 [Flavimaricola marinus]|uniref:Uncharacterized protein n=1 Tax=Flavimaricola marinus TaxID=1819565 RepID=A0A238LFQ8_9RHOB|nr:hypothetical protein LOM8899_01926 [Flavimaricola marinus]